MKQPVSHRELFPGQTPEEIFNARIVVANIPAMNGVVFETEAEVLEPGSKVKLGVRCLPRHINAEVTDFQRAKRLEISGS